MPTFTPDEKRRFYEIKPAGVKAGYVLDTLKCLRDMSFVQAKSNKKRKQQYKPTGFGVTRYNKPRNK